MSDWIIVVCTVSGLLSLAGLVHGIVRYRHLLKQEESQYSPVMSLSVAVWRQARKIVIFLVGGTVVLFGVMLLFLPGPGTLVVPVGLAILAIEFTWARRWLRRLRATLHLSAKRTRRWRRDRAEASEDKPATP